MNGIPIFKLDYCYTCGLGKTNKRKKEDRLNILLHDPWYKNEIVAGSIKKETRTKIPPSRLAKTLNEDQIMRLILKGH